MEIGKIQPGRSDSNPSQENGIMREMVRSRNMVILYRIGVAAVALSLLACGDTAGGVPD